jgi:iron complex transport system ATP-binding protein
VVNTPGADLLEVRKVSFSYRDHPVLEEVDLSLGKGELLAILGPNGAGKTTLFRCLLGLEKYRGHIRINGMDVARLHPRELAKKIAYIPQTNYPSFNYSVFEMTLMGTAAQGNEWSLPGPAQAKAALDALERTGMADLLERGFRTLSGGEQQLCLIARALAQRTETLIMDEPTANLDYGNQIHVLSRIKELCRQGCGIIISTHNPDHAFLFADRVAVLHHRRIRAAGSAAAVLTADMLADLYGIPVSLNRDTAGRIYLTPKV